MRVAVLDTEPCLSCWFLSRAETRTQVFGAHRSLVESIRGLLPSTPAAQTGWSLRALVDRFCGHALETGGVEVP